MYRSIQICRAIAALLVVLFHMGGTFSLQKYFGNKIFDVPFSFGHAGVEFFFVLSGFIITWIHCDDFGKANKLLPYLRKRIIRIYPAYWIIFGGGYLIALSFATLRSTVPHSPYIILDSLALLPQDSTISGKDGAPVLSVAWTLQYEMFFYVFFSIFILSRTLGVVVLIASLINYGTCHLSVCEFPRSFLSSDCIILFYMGVLVAYACRSPIRLDRPMFIVILAAAAFLATGLIETVAGRAQFPTYGRLIYGLFSGILIFALTRAEDGGQLFRNCSWLSLLGDSSYSLYLIHTPLISILCKLAIYIGLAGTSGGLITYPIVLSACVLFSLAFHLIIEKPILRSLSSSTSNATTVQAETPS